MEAANILRLPELKAEDRRLGIRNSIAHRPHGQSFSEVMLLSNSRIYILESARFRGVTTWTIGEDRFQLFSFSGGFLQMMTENSD